MLAIASRIANAFPADAAYCLQALLLIVVGTTEIAVIVHNCAPGKIVILRTGRTGNESGCQNEKPNRTADTSHCALLSAKGDYFAMMIPRSARHFLKTMSIASMIFTCGFALQYTITSCSVSLDRPILR